MGQEMRMGGTDDDSFKLSENVCVCMLGGWGVMGCVFASFLIFSSAGPPVNVAMAIEVASIDHISEANMVTYEVYFFMIVLCAADSLCASNSVFAKNIKKCLFA